MVSDDFSVFSGQIIYGRWPNGLLLYLRNELFIVCMYKRDKQADKNKDSTFNSNLWDASISVFCVDLRALRMLVSFQFANTRQEWSIYNMQNNT